MASKQRGRGGGHAPAPTGHGPPRAGLGAEHRQAVQQIVRLPGDDAGAE